MRLLVFGVLLSAGLALAGFQGPEPRHRAGAYRTAADYRRQRFAPGGDDAFLSDKRNKLVVVDKSGSGKIKTQVPLDSVWGFVGEKGRTVRLYRGEEYQLDYADTLAVYSSRSAPSATGLVYGPPRYFFSRGLNGFIFPLTPKYLAEMYEASNPAFAAAVRDLKFGQTLGDYDKKTRRYRVTTLYHDTQGKK